MAKKEHRRGSIKKQVRKDKFIEKGLSFFTLAHRHKNQFLWAGIGILIICCVGIYFYRTNRVKAEKASHELSQALLSYAGGDIERAITGFEDLFQLYSKTPAGIKSIYWLANIYYFQGKYNEAREFFKKYINRGKDPLIIQAGYLGIADTYFQEGNTFIASQKYSELVTKFPNSPLVPKALYQESQCYHILNQPARADSIQKTLSKSYPNSPYSHKTQLPIINLM